MYKFKNKKAVIILVITNVNTLYSTCVKLHNNHIHNIIQSEIKVCEFRERLHGEIHSELELNFDM